MPSEGLKADYEKIEFVVRTRLPQLNERLKMILMVCFFKRRFIWNFSHIFRLHHRLTKQKSDFDWTIESMQVPDILRRYTNKPARLAFPEKKIPFFVYMGASKCALGAALTPKDESEKWQPYKTPASL